MADDDWHRRTIWTESDKRAFFSRLERCRTESTRTQALRIQAGTLANHGMTREAIGLLNQLLSEYPNDYFRGVTYTSRAQCFVSLGEIQSAIADYRTALALESNECSNVQTEAWIELPWLVISEGREELYDEALEVFALGEEKQSLEFPASVYVGNSVRAIVSFSRDDHVAAASFAQLALRAANQDHSGLRYHPTTGLVTHEAKVSSLHRRLEEIAT